MTDRRAGFTLLEVVLAMTALALVVGICYGAFHLGIRAVERGEVAVVTEQRLRVASDVLIRQIKSAVPYAARNRDEDVYPFFVGTTTSLTFVTAAAQQGGGGLVRVVYRLEEDPTRLVLEESPFFSPDSLGRDPVDKPGRTSAVLLEGFRSLSFEYLYNDGADTEWRQAWDGLVDEMMPAAVRIVVTGMPGLELDQWGQEIPIMATAYGESTGEVDEEDIQTASDDDNTDDDSGGSRMGGRGATDADVDDDN
jgi:prepilin-type N-terminal cleavage/methylation domain-containing protein